MANVCESCRFGFLEPTQDAHYCEVEDEVYKLKLRCGNWACKLSRIGTPLEFEHSINRDKDGNWIKIPKEV